MAKKAFVFANYQQRYIALKYAYIGLRYDGVCFQRENKNTVEEKLFDALERVKLIENRDSCNFSRCGRTDKGVSAFSQVIGLKVRSALSKEELEEEQATGKSNPKEIDFPFAINGGLPEDIRILSWAPTTPEFNARYNCTYRVYHYYFPGHNLDIEAMRTAAKLLLGTHDFRNFCKVTKEKLESTFERTILEVSIDPMEKKESEDVLDLWNGLFYVFKIKGTGFLYHQVRCIMAILILIGKHHESEQVITDLLDIQKTPAKPNYNLASEIPLTLYDCGYEGIDFKPFVHPKVLYKYKAMIEENVTQAILYNELYHKMSQFEMTELRGDLKERNTPPYLTNDCQVKKYTPITKRPTGSKSFILHFTLELSEMIQPKRIKFNQ
jgi:tRNA pseudouridine38/39 synthase